MRRVMCGAASAMAAAPPTPTPPPVPMTASKDSFCLSFLSSRASLFESLNFKRGKGGRRGKENDQQLHAFLSLSRASFFLTSLPARVSSGSRLPLRVINDIICATIRNQRTLCIETRQWTTILGEFQIEKGILK